MASAAVAELQVQVNRLAGVGQFATIGVDGEVGLQTAVGVGSALTWISKDGCTDFLTCPSAGLRLEADQFLLQLVNFGTVDQQRIVDQASTLANYLRAYGDAVGIAAAPSVALAASRPPAVPVGTIPPKPKFPTAVPAPSSIVARFQRMPAWQQAGLGAAAILGVLFLNKRRHARGKKAA